ncbi:MAG: hypothetical protein AAFR09_01970 [Pseudomonadota bacterium]
MSLTLASLGLIYAACVALHHAHPKRTAFDRVRTHSGAQRGLRLGAVLLLAATQLLLAAAVGWERGIPIMLGVLAATGALSLIVATLAPRTHLPGGAALLGTGMISAGFVWAGL